MVALLLSMLHLCISLFIRSVSACGHRLQTGHRSSGGRHCQSDHSSDPQPRCQQQISRHLQHPVHTGHLSLTSNQPSSNTTQLILCLDSGDSDYSCLFFPSGDPGKQPAFRNCQQDKLGGLGWKVRLETSHLFFKLSFLAYFPPNSLTKLPSSGCLLQSCDYSVVSHSERADPNYCRDRLTEGSNINKSLVTLGIVISALGK